MATAVMDKATWLALLRQQRAIAVIRAPTFAVGIQMAAAVVAGGFRLIEITWTSDHPDKLVHHLRTQLPADCVVGVGTVLSSSALQQAIAAGAQFSFMPHSDPDLITLGQSHQIPVVPGALTPTEIMTAWSLGAGGVKVFPCAAVGGPAYIRHLQGPLGHIPLIPTGGISVESARDYLAQGAIAVGIASSLFPKTMVKQGDWSGIQARSRTFLQSLR